MGWNDDGPTAGDYAWDAANSAQRAADNNRERLNAAIKLCENLNARVTRLEELLEERLNDQERV